MRNAYASVSRLNRATSHVAIERMDDARRTLNAMFSPLARIEVTGPASGKAGGVRGDPLCCSRAPLIAEDEPHLREQLAERLNKLWPELEVVASVGDGTDAVQRPRPS